MKRTIFIKCLAIFFVVASCGKKQDTTNNGILNTAQIQELINTSYGTDSLQKMDIYLPANRSLATTGVIFMIHGGSWVAGDKADFFDAVNVIRTQAPTYAICNINYRLAKIPNINLWPTQLTDVNAALNFLASKSTEYSINTSKIAMVGASAGAQMALQKAYSANTTNSIKVVVDLFGPTDLIDLYNRPSDPTYPNLLGIFLSGTPQTNNANYVSASPLFAVNSSTPPTIIFHGTVDNTVPIRQSDSLTNRLIKAGVTQQYTRYIGEGHGWIGNNLNDTYNKIIAFVKQIMP